MENKTLEVKAVKSFGRIDIYPVNDLAIAFSELINKKVFSKRTMSQLKALGYEFKEVTESTI